jgi:hypothetical protein
MSKLCEDIINNPMSKYLYFGLVLVLLVLIFASKSEALTDWAAGVPMELETPQGYGYVESPMPYGGLGGPNIRFNVLSGTNEQPYSAGYVEKSW